MLTLDHLAFPCFDIQGTHRFYTEVLGCTLKNAMSGPAPTWSSRAFLLLAYELPDGSVIDFFSFVGILRPHDPLPKDIRHIALTVPTRDDVHAWKRRIEAARVSHWTETHEEGDLHVYVTDPNGLVLEITAACDGARQRPRDSTPEAVLEAWLENNA